MSRSERNFGKWVRAELARDRRAKQRAEIRELRARIAHAKKWRTQRIRDVRALCRAALRLAKQRAREVRAAALARCRLEAEHAVAESFAREQAACAVRRERAAATAADKVARAKAILDAELRDQRIERLNDGRARRKGEKRKAPTAAERRAESDDEVRHNIPRELLPVWEVKKRTIKPTERASRTEVFLEWAAEHAADVQEIIDRDVEASVAELVRHEAEQRRALGEGELEPEPELEPELEPEPAPELERRPPPRADYSAEHSVTRALYDAAGFEPDELERIGRLERGDASLRDVFELEPLAESIGLPWRDLFPELTTGEAAR